MDEPLKIVGISGSVRRPSYNRAALVAAQGLLTSGISLEVFDLDRLPKFSLDMEARPTPEVGAFKERIRAADAILFSAPEYMYSILHVLGNAINWGASPAGDNAWAGKPVAIMSVSGGFFDLALAQYHLRHTLASLGAIPVPHPEVMIWNAGNAFDHNGRLVDRASQAELRSLLECLVVAAREARGRRAAPGQRTAPARENQPC